MDSPRYKEYPGGWSGPAWYAAQDHGYCVSCYPVSSDRDATYSHVSARAYRLGLGTPSWEEEPQEGFLT